VLASDQIFPSYALNFNNGSAYDYVNDNTMTTSGGTYQSTEFDNTIGWTNYAGTNVDGISTGITDMASYTFSGWYYINETQTDVTMAFSVGSVTSIYTGIRAQGHASENRTLFAERQLDGTQQQCQGAISNLYNHWIHLTYVIDGEDMLIYQDGVIDASCPGVLVGGTNTDLPLQYLGTYGTNTLDLTGAMDNLFIYDSVLTPTQIQQLYNESAPLYLYKQSGSYESQIFNSTAINPEIQVNLWESAQLNNYFKYTGVNQSYLNSSTIQFKANDDPALTGASYVALTFNGTHYLPVTSPNGQYGQYKLTMNNYDSYGLYPENVLSVTMNNYQYTTPWVTNATIPLTSPYTVNTTTGYATSSLNDTDTMQMNFFWYVNGINVLNESSSGQSNGSEADSTLDSSNYVKYDVINFIAVTCLEDQPAVCSSPTWSNNATVLNSNYNYTFTPPTNSTIQIAKPQGRMFAITFTTDIDDDVTVSWLVDGVEVSTADSLTLGSSSYLDYAILTLVANITDGEFNNTETWTVEILPTEIQAVGAIALTMFILFVIGIFFFLPFFAGKFTKNEFLNLILKRGCWVIAIYLGMNAAAIMATIAENSGLPLTQEMFTYMWILGVAGYLMMGFMVLKTLFDVVDMYKLNKNNRRMGD